MSAPTTSSAKPPIATSYYQVSQFGFHYASINEHHGEYYYPTYLDYHPPGMFTLGTSSHATGDFNGDGFQDLIIGWVAFPHTVAHATPVTPTIFLNDGQGNLLPANTIVSGSLPNIHMGYRIVVADFNGDGRDDFAQGSMGRLERLPDGSFSNVWEPMTLVLSQPDGTLATANHRIEGQENGGVLPGFTFAHDMSCGDVDGDGDIDIYTARYLLLNDGSGNFSNAQNQLHPDAYLFSNYAMSSAMGDVDNDGSDDLLVAYAEGGPTFLFLSRWQDGIAGWERITLPEGPYGTANTKVNYATMADVNGDGLKDVLLAQTRAVPYYDGRIVQILINQGGGTFADETSARIDNAPRDHFHGEGELKAVDIDRDGDLDLVDSSETVVNGQTFVGGTSIALNDGTGHFRWVASDAVAYVQPFQLSGYEFVESFQTLPVGRMIPIDLDGVNGIDFVGAVQTPLLYWPQQEPSSMTLYTVRNTVPLGSGIDGTSKEDVLSGTIGSDLINGFGGNDVLSGLQGNDTLNGGAGNDNLDGGAGADILDGGSGNDTYDVDDVYDQIIEGSSGGWDVVRSSVSYALNAAAEIEVFMAAGTASISLTGNGFSNAIYGNAGGNSLFGEDGHDTLNGGLGDDRLLGGNGNDLLQGGDGADILDGNAGADMMEGGSGNDTFYVDHAEDKVNEAAGGGVDTIYTSVSFSLGASLEVERLTAAGTANLSLVGNKYSNIITGNSGSNKLNGGLGNDQLRGGAGKDTFVFDTKLNKKTNVDKILDFSSASDSLWLDNAVFTKLGKGSSKGVKFKSDMFVEASRAQDAEDRIVYHRKSGALYYDADGTGRSAQVKIATISNKAKLYYHDFFVI